MRLQQSWLLAGVVGLPLMSMTVYLVWIWPGPSGTSLLAQVGPYLVCLLTGVPFLLGLTRGSSRVLFLVVYVAVGFMVLWVYAMAFLCGIRGICL